MSNEGCTRARARFYSPNVPNAHYKIQKGKQIKKKKWMHTRVIYNILTDCVLSLWPRLHSVCNMRDRARARAQTWLKHDVGIIFCHFASYCIHIILVLTIRVFIFIVVNATSSEFSVCYTWAPCHTWCKRKTWAYFMLLLLLLLCTVAFSVVWYFCRRKNKIQNTCKISLIGLNECI